MPPHSAAEPSRQCKVAVIGAGAAGLVAARELRREGHDVVLLEQQGQLGGTWIYTDEVDGDLLGRDASRRRVHSSMYQGLTTNLPREIMGFADFPFSTAAMAGSSIDARRYPCSEEVLRYLQAFAQHYHLTELIRFNCQVQSVQHAPAAPAAPAAAAAAGPPDSSTAADIPWKRWEVQWQQLPAATSPASSSNPPSPAAAVAAAADGSMYTELFDAVLVCNGHYSEPKLPQLPGAEGWPGLLMHSHNYRSAERFKGQHVAVLGASFSGQDVARLVAQQAACVYLCAREWTTQQQLDAGRGGAAANIQRRGMITQLNAAGGAEFAVGQAVPQLDAVICCTGYNYSFPFLDLQALGLSTAQQHVAPLFQHMFVPGQGPGLAFIGLPWRVVPFPMFELQAKLCGRVLSGRASLPPAAEMAAWVQQHDKLLAAEGRPPSQSHYLDYKQLEYHAWLASIWCLEWCDGVFCQRLLRETSPPPGAGQFILAQHALAHPRLWRHFLDDKAKPVNPLPPRWPDLKDDRGRAVWLNSYEVTDDARGALRNLVEAGAIQPANMVVIE
uniref:Flavin-containing monooxygenase n=1 Tax=Tetradesmus obliquus TaxID=3088 RepID=A0A383VB45_TETOB|eukprot:jgi/Sobl393_1/3378/SZX61969.1